MEFTDKQLKTWAAEYVSEAASDLDFVGVGEQFDEDWADFGLSFDERQDLMRRVHDLACSATVTVSWDGKPDEVEQPRAEGGRAVDALPDVGRTAEAAIRRVRARHSGVCSGACGLDDACECEDRDLVCDECNDRWPCGTIRDLDNPEARK